MFFLLLSLYVCLESKTTGEQAGGKKTTTPPSLPAGVGRVKSHMGAGGIISPGAVKKKKMSVCGGEREKNP